MRHIPAMRHTLLLTALAGLLAAGSAGAQTAPSQNRGALLYSTHCIACHTTEVHWRGRKLVTDWSSLMVQVRRWQSVQQLNWSDDDIVQVARHLNARFYKVKETGDKGAPSAAAGAAPGPLASRP
ncbi:MAG: cytochrome C [Burkholderiaceae bacterium]|jgi:mono/diheme cytochrome c family protein|nr:cytochrome C [Burkholderiaceae bacterium]